MLRRATALVAVLAVGVGGWWWLSRDDGPPRILGPEVGGYSAVFDPVPVARATGQFGIMAPYGTRDSAETLTFRSATVTFRKNTADAVAIISVCRPRGTPNGSIGGGGAVLEPDLTKYCVTARPVTDGTTLRWGTESDPGEMLVLTVRARRPGIAEVGSFTFDYARDAEHGGQSGVEVVADQEFTVQAH